jgi:hypothetical protein
VLRSLGAPLGEAVADDFDFLHHALLEGRHGVFDGGGSLAFWRPFAHQGYFSLVGRLVLAHPGAIAALHTALLGAGSLLIYRMLRPSWPGHLAAIAASFPLIAESARTLITWPAEMVEIGPFLFSALALHEASRRRMGTALGSLLAALLFKEVAMVTALMLPWVPQATGEARRPRARWILGSAIVVAVWGIAYLLVRRHAGLALPHHLETDPAMLHTSLVARLKWATWNSVLAVFSLELMAGRWDLWILGGAAAIVLVAGARLARSPRARACFAHRAGWTWWGLAWFALSCGVLVPIFPIWAPARTLFGSVGLGVALAAALDAALPALAPLLLGVRLAALVASPPAPPGITSTPPERGAFADFPKVTRLQRLMRETRQTLLREYPNLPRGAMIGQQNMPMAAEYAFEGSRALHVWYRDTTMRWVRYEDFARARELPLTTIVQYEEFSSPQIALIDIDAMRELLRAQDAINRDHDVLAARAAIERADSLQTDRDARAFLGKIAGIRAVCLYRLGDPVAGEREASRAMTLWHANPEARMLLAASWASRGDFPRAMAALETLVALEPTNRVARVILDRLQSLPRPPPGGPPSGP